MRRVLRPEPGWVLGVLAATVAGAIVRWIGLRGQVLTGDELHTVNGALSRGVGQILHTWTYFGADYCVPLTAFFRFLMDRGVVLGELGFRAPVLAAGVATPLLLAWLWRRHVGRAPSLVLAWLLALSPMLVLYGRIVRSYAPVVLCANAAVLAFERAWRGRSRGAAVAYVLLAAFSIWLHLGAAPFVLAPFAWAAIPALRDGKGIAPTLRRLAPLLVATAAAIALVLLPAARSLVELEELHGGGHAPDLATWLEVLRLQSGSRSLLLAALLGAAAVRGAVLLARRDADLALYLGVLALGQVAGLVVLAPNFLQAVVVANRYVLVLLPTALALVALGAAQPLAPRAGPRARALQGAAVAALVAAVFLTGPLASAEYRWSSYTHAQPFVNFLQPGDSVPPEHVPRFYRELPPGDEPILEVPWTNVGTHAFAAYQRVHRHPLRVASVDKIHADPRIALRNTVPARVDRMRHSGARWVVVHLDLRREELWVRTTELRHAERLDRLPELWQVLHVAGSRLAAGLEARWGPPVYSDESIRVWDLSALPPPPSGPADASPGPR